MAIRVPNGALFAIASGLGAAITLSALSNGSPAQGTTPTAHSLLAGDIVVVSSGWSRLTDKAVRVAPTPGSTTFGMENIDTTLASIYPPGGGVGSVRRVTAFTQLAQVLTSATSGGEQQFTTYQLLEGDAQKQIPSFKNPSQLTLSIADDPTLAGYILASQANDDRLPRVVRLTLPDGSTIYYNAYISLNKTPSLTVNEVMACQVTISLLNEVVRYAA